MKIKPELYLSAFFSIIFISFIIWNRFIRERLTRNLIPITEITDFFLITLSLTIIFTTLAIYYFLLMINYFPKKKSNISFLINYYYDKLLQKKWFNNVVFFVQSYILNSFANSYAYIYRYIYVKPIIEFIGRILSDYFFNSVFLVYFVMFVLPKIIPIFILLIEIILTHRIYYFYKNLYILLIPICFNALLHMIDHHAKAIIDYYDYYFIIKNDDNVFNIHDRIFNNDHDKKIQKSIDTDAIIINWVTHNVYLISHIV